MITSFLKLIQDKWKLLEIEAQSFTYQKGQILFYKNHHPYGVFVLQSGKVIFETDDEPKLKLKKGRGIEPNCDSKNHEIPSSHGTLIGVDPLVNDESYCCSCIAIEDCKGIFLTKTQIRNLCTDKDCPLCKNP